MVINMKDISETEWLTDKEYIQLKMEIKYKEFGMQESLSKID
jgi:hypothetical protein